MPFYVKITDECEESAKKYNQLSALQKVKENIEKFQNITGFEHFPNINFIKRPLSNNYRLIGYQIEKEENNLIILLNILKRDSNDYFFFLENVREKPNEIKKRFLTVDDSDIEFYLKELTKTEAPKNLPELNNDEKKWLYEVFLSREISDIQNDLMILETEEWVSSINDQNLIDHMRYFHGVLYENIGKFDSSKDNTDIKLLKISDAHGFYGIFYLFRNDLKKILLIKPIYSRKEIDIDYTSLSIYGILEKDKDNDEIINKLAIRSYPILMLLEYDYWKAIQKDEEANLALSPEESELLDSLTIWNEEKAGFPLFINGRAGSGKSTMLQYLAGEYLYFGIKNKMPHNIIYMTYSRDLLDRAKKIVKGIITLNYEKLLHHKIDEKLIDEKLDQTFVVFSDYLFSLLPENLKFKFSMEKYIDYPKFRMLWGEQFARRRESRDISVELAWHTIRTYIKGMRTNYDDDLSPEEFQSLPKRRKTVSIDTYKNVYEKVWKSWYKRLCNEENFWDDQDLAVTIYENQIYPTFECSAIFCDEAQDFSAIELRVITHLSLFSKRTLTPEELKRVPIVFAGDPLQTINPTGFSWEATKEQFHSIFTEILDPRRKKRLEINFVDLTFNYRSNPGVVKFCNTIQLMRSHFLNSKEAIPQQSWWVYEPVTIGIFHDEITIKDKLKNRPDLVILINCEAGEETLFVNKDSLLKGLKKQVENVYQNVFSPMRAKGLEFQGVVLYRFVDSFLTDKDTPFSVNLNLNDQEKRLPYEYFFNRLYVAASRAKNHLCIVDSKDSIDKFWKKFFEKIDEILSTFPDPEIWRKNIALTFTENTNWWDGESTSLEDEARKYELEGRKKRDSFLLRQAALCYLQTSIGERKYIECLAEADYIDGNYKKSGYEYLKIGMIDRAFHSFWKGTNWLDLLKLSENNDFLKNKNEIIAVKLIISESKDLDLILLDRILNLLEDKSFLKNVIVKDLSWNILLQKLSEKLYAIRSNTNLNWHRIYEVYKNLSLLNLKIDPNNLAFFAYNASDLQFAVKLWEELKSTESHEYRKSKAKITPFPENMYWLGLEKNYNEILKTWRENKNKIVISEIDDNSFKYLVDSMIENHIFNEALELLLHKPIGEKIIKIFTNSIESNDPNLVYKSIQTAIKYFIVSQRYSELLNVIERLDFTTLISRDSKRISDKLSKTLNYSQIYDYFHREFSKLESDELFNLLNKLWEKSDFINAVNILKYYQNEGIALKLFEDALNKANTELAESLLVVFVRYMIFNRKWDELINFLEKQDFMYLIKNFHRKAQPSQVENQDENIKFDNLYSSKIEQIKGKINFEQFWHSAFCLLGTSDILIKEKIDNRDKISNFVKKHFINRGVDYKIKNLSPKLIGCVIEKAGKHSDAIKFYKNLLSDYELTSEETKFYNSRLVKVCNNLSDYFRKKKDEIKSAEYQKIADNIIHKYNISSELIEDFPFLTLNDLKFAEQKMRKKQNPIKEKKIILEKINSLKERLKIDHSKDNTKVRFENEAMFETCTFNFKVDNLNDALKGDAQISIVNPENDELIAWQVQKWNVRISLKVDGDRKILILKDIVSNETLIFVNNI